MPRLMEYFIFHLMKILYHCTHKHSLFVYYVIAIEQFELDSETQKKQMTDRINVGRVGMTILLSSSYIQFPLYAQITKPVHSVCVWGGMCMMVEIKSPPG